MHTAEVFLESHRSNPPGPALAGLLFRFKSHNVSLNSSDCHSNSGLQFSYTLAAHQVTFSALQLGQLHIAGLNFNSQQLLGASTAGTEYQQPQHGLCALEH